MLPSLLLIYYGDCRDMIDFYSTIFDNIEKKIQTYSEMPLFESYGIKEQELDMVWQASLKIHYGNNAVSLKLSDSMLTAMRSPITYQGQAYNPLICIEHNDEQYVRDLFANLYCGEHSFDEIQKGIHSDKYGIRWVYKKSDNCSIYYCFEFNGDCIDVVEYIKDTFIVNSRELITYADSPHVDKIKLSAPNKIYSAVLSFEHGGCCYALKFSDNLDSAIHGFNGYSPDAKLSYQIILAVEDDDAEQLIQSFGRLSVGAKLNKPIARNADGSVNGSLIDRYGLVWELMTCNNS